MIVDKLEEHLKNIQKYRTNIWFKKNGHFQSAEITLKRGITANGEWRNNRSFVRAQVADQLSEEDLQSIPAAFQQARKRFDNWEPVLESLLVHTNYAEGPLTSDWNCLVAVEPDQVLYKLTRSAWCELFAITPTELPSNADPIQYRTARLRDFLLSLLQQGQTGVNSWNALRLFSRREVDFTGTDFSNLELSSILLHNFDGKRSRFDGAAMQRAQLIEADVCEASFIATDLASAVLISALAQGTNFTQAKLTGANMFRAKLQNAILKEADLTDTDLKEADLRGVDLSTCNNLSKAFFSRTQYDETTTLPAHFLQWSQLLWVGNGNDPYRESLKAAAVANLPSDFPGLIKHLLDRFDKPRVKKAISMLKKETFQLFSEVEEDQITGIVKSQTNTELVYACRLTSSGRSVCYTQNLRPCGGLRDMVCKHILVLVIGLTKAGKIAASDAARCVMLSQFEPLLQDKDGMSEVFLKYKGAETSEIDWRPTETIPEDYYAF